MTQKQLRCSVLICVYRGDVAKYVLEAVESICQQSVEPDDIVVVVDGFVGRELQEVLKLLERKKNIKIVRMDRNVGVGAASNEGLKYCKHELVAKMDADDVAAADRLEKQLVRFAKDPKLVLLGGQLAEFVGNTSNVVSHRRAPVDIGGIRSLARSRSPFNNQTVMYKKSVVQKLGGYPRLNRAEDYYLFAKIMANGYKVANLPEVLVYFRMDRDAMKRRKTWRHTREIIKARYEIWKLGVVSNWGLFKGVAGQLFVFVMPSFVMKIVYWVLRKS